MKEESNLFRAVKKERFLLGDNSVRADGKRNNHVMFNCEQHAIFVRDVKIKNLVVMPRSAFELVDIQRRMTPIIPEYQKFCVSNALNL